MNFREAHLMVGALRENLYGSLRHSYQQQGQPTKGLLHSPALTTVERLHVDAERQRLVVEVDMADREFFRQPPARLTMEYSPSDLKSSRSSARSRV